LYPSPALAAFTHPVFPDWPSGFHLSRDNSGRQLMRLSAQG
jgi:hypothetical protein